MISCERSAGGGRTSPYRFTNFSTRNIQFAGVGTAVNAVFPSIRRLATLDLQAEAGIMSLSLASSIINATPLDTCGLFVALDRGEALSLEGAFDVFLSHVTRQNSIAGLPSSSSRTNTLAFGDATLYRLPSGVKLAIYGSSANAAANELTALLSVFWTPASALG